VISGNSFLKNNEIVTKSSSNTAYLLFDSVGIYRNNNNKRKCFSQELYFPVMHG